jgi:hypothetical protein
MDAALKEFVVPLLRLKGFKGSLPHFRRALPHHIELLTFQFDKWGGGFVLEIARCPTSGIVTSWGKSIAPNKVTAWDTNERERIQPGNGHGTESWFRFDTEPVQNVAAQVVNLLPRAEAWWQQHA